MASIPADYYDGRSARRVPVSLSIEGGWLMLKGAELELEIPFSSVRVSEKLGSAPRQLHLADGGHCAVSDHAAFEALLQGAGVRPRSLVSRLEGYWHYAVGALLLSIACVVAGFIWGLPWAAEVAADRIPYSTAHIIDKHVLSTFDQGMLQPSKLSPERQRELQQRFDTLRAGRDLPDYPLQFRNSPAIGANAFALPGGTVVVTDALVQLADNDEEILGVLAHELGHVSERHPLRQLLQGSVVALAMTWYVGDISSLLAAAPTLLLQTSYSRNFERRADRFAADMLRSKGIPPTRLADMLEKLEQTHRKAHPQQQAASVDKYFATHPDTAERIRSLRENNPGAQ